MKHPLLLTPIAPKTSLFKETEEDISGRELINHLLIFVIFLFFFFLTITLNFG